MVSSRRRRQSGFTLIEVVITAAIVGLLAAAIMPSVVGTDTQAKNARIQADLKQIATAVQLWRIRNGSYPPNLNVLWAYDANLNPTPYLTSIPVDAYGMAYVYGEDTTTTPHSWYVYSFGANKTDDSRAGDDVVRIIGND